MPVIRRLLAASFRSPPVVARAGRVVLALGLATGVLGLVADRSGASAPVFLGSQTGCHWSELTAAGRIFNYGSFASIRPDAPTVNAEYQVSGSGAMPSVDESEGPGMTAGDKVTYRVYAPDVAPDARPVELPSTTERRATTWTDNPTLTWTQPGGDYVLSLYAYDYENVGRVEQVTVGVGGGGSATTTFTPSGGTYQHVLVHVPGTSAPLTVRISATSGTAVLSGVFLDAAGAPLTGVKMGTTDTTTLGNWVGKYGSQAWILAGVQSPGLPGSLAPWTSTQDEFSLGSTGPYSVVGSTAVWTGVYPNSPQPAPSFAFAYTGWLAPATDGRDCSFWINNPTVAGPPSPGDLRGTTWDAGAKGLPLSVDLHVPANLTSTDTGFTLSAYLMDWDHTGRSETVKLISGGVTLDAESVGPATALANGELLRWQAKPDTDYTLQVVPDANSVASLSGLFLDETGSVSGSTSTTSTSSTSSTSTSSTSTSSTSTSSTSTSSTSSTSTSSTSVAPVTTTSSTSPPATTSPVPPGGSAPVTLPSRTFGSTVEPAENPNTSNTTPPPSAVSGSQISRGALAFTGQDSETLLLMAGVLVMLGLTLVAASRSSAHRAA